MRLMLTGVIPFWFLLLLFAAMSALFVFIYRKQPLPRPWSILLPGLRLLSIALVMLALLQPVASFTHTEHLRGQIPVMISIRLAGAGAPPHQMNCRLERS